MLTKIVVLLTKAESMINSLLNYQNVHIRHSAAPPITYPTSKKEFATSTQDTTPLLTHTPPTSGFCNPASILLGSLSPSRIVKYTTEYGRFMLSLLPPAKFLPENLSG